MRKGALKKKVSYYYHLSSNLTMITVTIIMTVYIDCCGDKS